MTKRGEGGDIRQEKISKNEGEQSPKEKKSRDKGEVISKRKSNVKGKAISNVDKAKTKGKQSVEKRKIQEGKRNLSGLQNSNEYQNSTGIVNY